MPGLPGCTHCPFRDDPDTPCAVLATGHTRFCTAIDPGSPTHRPGMRRGLVRLTMELLGRPVPPEPRVPKAFPPLMQQARDLAGAVVDAVASGGKTVSPEEKARRLAICHGCDQLVEGRCAQCGCVTSWKARLEAWHCPIGKW